MLPIGTQCWIEYVVQKWAETWEQKISRKRIQEFFVEKIYPPMDLTKIYIDCFN